jgi:hypothetical protein
VDEVLWYDNFTEQKSKLKSWLDSRGKKFFQIPNEMPRQYIPKDKNHDS